jgi:hypothetical protein
MTISKSQLLQTDLIKDGWQKLPINFQTRKNNSSLWELEEDNFLVFHKEISPDTLDKSWHNNANFNVNLPQNSVRENTQDLTEKSACLETHTVIRNLITCPNSSQTNDLRHIKNDSANPTMGVQTYNLALKYPEARGIVYETSGAEDPCSSILKSMRCDDASFILSLDTEFYYEKDGTTISSFCEDELGSVKRKILSWQFCFLSPVDCKIHEILVFGSHPECSLSLHRVLSYILDTFGIYKYYQSSHEDGITVSDVKCWEVPVVVRSKRGKIRYEIRKFYTFNEALDACKWHAVYYGTLKKCGPDKMVSSIYDSVGNISDNNGIRVDELDGIIPVGYKLSESKLRDLSVRITLVCHSGKADLSTFALDDNFDIMKHVSDVHGGLCSLTPSRINVPVYTKRRHHRFYPVTLDVRDTMCLAPSKQKSLAAIGKCAGIDKIEIDDKYDKGNMREFLEKDPVEFARYAINDAVICLVFSGKMWGYNTCMPTTIAAAAVKAAVSIMMKSLNCKNRKEFNLKFKGLVTEDAGLIDTRSGFVKKTVISSVSQQAKLLRSMASDSFKGGYNASMTVGYFNGDTYDYDLNNAYPTIMSVVADTDWESDDILCIVKNNFDLDYMYVDKPFDIEFAYGSFEFPKSVKYPCIPVNVDGCIIYPRSVKNGVYMACPEMYLAIQVGAKIHADTFIVARHRGKNVSDKPVLFEVIKRFIAARKYAEEKYGKDSLEALLMKEGVNSIYGKCAQNVIPKKSWSSSKNGYVNIGESAITSPVIASITTSGVRSILLAVLNELSDMGYNAYSVTTDGFITDAPKEVVENLSLYGFADKLRSARFYLVQDGTIWQIKHHQKDLVNITTRGNTSLEEHGVNAHNSFKTGETEDTLEDRLAYENAVMSRQGPVKSSEIRFTTFRKLSDTENRMDFAVTVKERNISMDFDLKRKPDRESIRASYSRVIKDGENYVRVACDKDDEGAQEMACFTTSPYDTVEEYKLYKKVSKNFKCLRTVNEWNAFFEMVDDAMENASKNFGRNIVVNEHKIIMSCLIAYRQKVPLSIGIVDIPYLSDKKHALSDKLKWINSFVISGFEITENDWKHASRKSRVNSILPEEIFINTLKKMMESC